MWPATGFPPTTVGAMFSEQLDVKIPSTLIEAVEGDTSLVTIDTLGQTFYIGNWPVDSMMIVGVYDLPPGIVLDCNTNNCVFEGGTVGCGELHGVSTTVGVYAADAFFNLYTSGVVTINLGGVPLTIPMQQDFYSQFGHYDTIYQYTIEVIPATGIKILDNNLSVSHFHSNNNTIEIEINTNYNDDVLVSICDILGRTLYNDILQTNIGKNKYLINKKLDEGIYIIAIKQRDILSSKKVLVSNNY
jgi:hypothetical protein